MTRLLPGFWNPQLGRLVHYGKYRAREGSLPSEFVVNLDISRERV
jgi:hypothetical protein